VATMADADVVVIVLSELISNSFVKNAPTYAEFEGDVESIDTVNPADISLLAQARMSGKPVAAIIISGRPVLINSPAHPATLANADAWIAAWLPGTEGEGVADVLFGDYPPTGKLSHSWPPDDTFANIMCGTLRPATPRKIALRRVATNRSSPSGTGAADILARELPAQGFAVVRPR
jgi:hypothetical protein